jgi:hypothetical protein
MRPAVGGWVVLTVAAGLANFFFPILAWAFESEYLFALTTGIAASELALLGVAGALGPGRHIARLPLTLAIAALLLFLLMSGLVAADGGPLSPREARQWGAFFLVLPAALLAVQSPLWIVRAATGYRMGTGLEHDGNRRAAKVQFGVRQIMLATALIAVALAMARGAVVWWSPPGGDVGENWTGVAVACGVLALASLLVTVPCVLVVLTRQRGIWAAAIFLYIAGVATVEVAVMAALAGSGLPPDVIALLTLFCVTTFGGVLSGLGVLRRDGYVLVRY